MASSSLSVGIENAEHALDLCLSNKFTEAQNFLEPLDSGTFYHVVSKATISCMQAVLTYEPELINIAYEKVKEASIVCDRFRRKQSWGETFQSLVYSTSYADSTQEELHAELCYAECLLEWAMLTFIQDENLISFIKGGLKIRNAYNIYKNCLMALNQKPKCLETKNKVDFQSGVYFGIGLFNLLLSLLPARVLRLLEWVGFSGDKVEGLHRLDECYLLDGLRSPISSISLLGYHIVASPLLGMGVRDEDYVKSIIEKYLKRFPEGSMFLYFSGRLKQTRGELYEALGEYEKSVSLNMDWQQVHHICYWEMTWCYSFLVDWEKAALYAEKLSLESKWSKSSYSYMQACLLLMHQEKATLSEEQHKKLTSKIESLFDDVVKYKQRIAGKSIPFEKFAVCRVEKYRSTGMLVLAGLELIHVWNGFTVLCKHKQTVAYFLNLVNETLDKLAKNEDSSKHHYDNVRLCELLKGICLRHLDCYDEALEVLDNVAKSPPSSHYNKMEYYVPPYASAEIAFMYKDMDKKKEASKKLQHTLKNYSKYGLESRLHFRIHSAIEMLKSDEKSNGGCISPSSSTSSSPCKDWIAEHVGDDISHSHSEYDILSQTQSVDEGDGNLKSNADCISKENELQEVFHEENIEEIIEPLSTSSTCTETKSTVIPVGLCTADKVIDNTFTKLNSATSDNQVSEASSCISPNSRPKNQDNVTCTKVTSL